MTPNPLAWHEFDPESPRLPDGLEHPGSPGRGGVSVALLATAGARSDAWAPRAAASLARAWAHQGERVLLVDLDLRRPELHQVLGEENGEGVSDAVLWGASLARIARSRDDQGLSFVPAGTVASDPEGIFSHPRWSEVVGEARRSGRSVVAYLPVDEPGVLEVARGAGVVVLLSTSHEREVAASGLEDVAVQAVVGPPAAGQGGAREDDPGDVSLSPAPATGETGVRSGPAPDLESDPVPAAREPGPGEPGDLLPALPDDDPAAGPVGADPPAASAGEATEEEEPRAVRREEEAPGEAGGASDGPGRRAAASVAAPPGRPGRSRKRRKERTGRASKRGWKRWGWLVLALLLAAAGAIAADRFGLITLPFDLWA